MATRLDPGDGARIIPFDQLAPMLRVIPSLPRPLLARLTEKLIERLDEIDGDCDLEDDDPAGDMLDKGEMEEHRDWETGFRAPLPTYAMDQTKGPINEREVTLAYHRHLHGLDN